MHPPARPSWQCRSCGEDWPCATRRAQLLAEYLAAPVSLALYLGACFVDAAGDLPQASAGHLYHRFVGWPRAQRR